MELVVGPSGQVRCVYSEGIDLKALGRLDVRRASHVEPDCKEGWVADMSPVGGPSLGPFELRSSGLAAEQAWLESHWLMQPSSG
jgi:hypothetical protein